MAARALRAGVGSSPTGIPDANAGSIRWRAFFGSGEVEAGRPTIAVFGKFVGVFPDELYETPHSPQ